MGLPPFKYIEIEAPDNLAIAVDDRTCRLLFLSTHSLGLDLRSFSRLKVECDCLENDELVLIKIEKGCASPDEKKVD